MAREGTRGASTRKKSPKKASSNDASAAGGDGVGESNSMEATVDAVPYNTSAQQQQPQPHPLARKEGEGLTRKSVLTGLYGSRGERIRHVVATGALAMPPASLELMAQFEDPITTASTSSTAVSSKSSGKSSNNKKRKTYPLPGLDSVIRPTKDPSLQTITVTDIFHKAFPHLTA